MYYMQFLSRPTALWMSYPTNSKEPPHHNISNIFVTPVSRIMGDVNLNSGAPTIAHKPQAYYQFRLLLVPPPPQGYFHAPAGNGSVLS
jgi:hypothetical protein